MESEKKNQTETAISTKCAVVASQIKSWSLTVADGWV